MDAVYLRITDRRKTSILQYCKPDPTASKEAVDKIPRYETTIERQLYRTMGQLEKLQRRCRGEPTIPPITVDVMKEEGFFGYVSLFAFTLRRY
jgi:hypothetical protein